jgi:ABC-2 type transport system permease protein
MLSILRKEVNGFLNSLTAYVVMGVFLTAIGLLMWVFPETSVLAYGFADMDTLFSTAPFVFMFLIPAITMRSFAEESRAGTMEVLLTKPIPLTHLILGKFLASFLLVVVAVLPTVVYYYSVYRLGNGNVDTAAVIGSYVGLILLGGVFCAVGVWASSISANQIVAFLLAAFLCFLLFSGFDSLANLRAWSSQVLVIKQLGLLYHYESLSRGLIDTRNVVYLISIAAGFLLLTKLVIASHKW